MQSKKCDKFLYEMQHWGEISNSFIWVCPDRSLKIGFLVISQIYREWKLTSKRREWSLFTSESSFLWYSFFITGKVSTISLVIISEFKQINELIFPWNYQKPNLEMIPYHRESFFDWKWSLFFLIFVVPLILFNTFRVFLKFCCYQCSSCRKVFERLQSFFQLHRF